LLSSRSLKLAVLGLTLVAGGCDSRGGDGAQPPQGAETDVPEAAADPAQTGGIDRRFAGSPIPAVTVTDPAGRTMDLASLKGTPFVLNLWATWCAPCLAELPTLDALEKSGTIKVIAVSQDMGAGQAKVPAFLRKHDAPTLAPWIEPEGNLAFDFGGNLPITVLYDGEGKEVWRWTGGNEWDSAEARKLLAEAG
jgi:thiol-disulfide isomerase/thioredoxin